MQDLQTILREFSELSANRLIDPDADLKTVASGMVQIGRLVLKELEEEQRSASPSNN